MIEVKNLCVSYQQNHYILENINLNIKKGSFNIFIGETGIGKTTLLKMISGLIRPNKGEIIIGDQNLNKLSQPYHLKPIKQHVTGAFHYGLYQLLRR